MLANDVYVLISIALFVRFYCERAALEENAQKRGKVVFQLALLRSMNKRAFIDVSSLAVLIGCVRDYSACA